MTRRPNTSKQTRALLVLLLQSPQQWRHGYDLARETGLKSGTLYPLLLRLADQALLEAKWVESAQQGKPPRHAYRLSPAGVALATSIAAAAQAGSRGRLAGAMP